MNEHLKPVFSLLLPRLEKAGIDYWVYGGVAIAGIKGYFYRCNKDIDIFVLNKNYKKANDIIKETSDKNLWIFKPAKLLGTRPKNELFIDGKERLSIVPIYETDSEVKFIFEKRPKIFSGILLKSVIRYIGKYKFITPSEDLLKELLRFYLESFFKSERKRNDKKLWEKRKLDAEKLLGNKETKKLFIIPNSEM